ncbi:helix-turn-helix domain-containing protein [Halococcus sp. AFM35]|uniref:helix-turn-helix domain-containing protein n=1 Tax=Halococcus sp. AFM35 TaxID=3421653 RepID=UPI003EBE8A2B
MNKLSDVDTDQLRAALATVSDAKAAKRLMVALAYADGVRVETLSERYDIPRATVYSWLDRFERQPVREAITDDHRPGRPPKLGERQRERLAAALADSPDEHGHETAEWNPALVRRHIEREYGVTYSLGHARRLYNEIRDPS